MAIIGPSGAGKTSLLNVLAKKITHSKKSKLSGTVTFNGLECRPGEIGKFSGFVSQEDVLLGSMTTLEILRFTAALSLPDDFPQEKKDMRINDLIRCMGLDKCKDSYVGNTGLGSTMSGIKRGISGGERKRVSICVELMNDPTLLFCDEPTSGLDSFASKIVVEKLQQLAFLGKTVIATIHQPSSEIFRLFNRLVILADGKPIFFGDRDKATNYFSKLGYVCPKFINPADYLLKVVQVPPTDEGGDDMEQEEGDDTNVQFKVYEDVGLRNATREQVNRIQEEYLKSKFYKDSINPPPLPPTKDEHIHAKSSHVSSYWKQYYWVLWRSWNNVLREPALFKVRIIAALIMALLAGLVWLNINDHATGAQDRVSATFFLILSQLFGGINGPVYLFPSERGVYFRENRAKLYNSLPYYLAKLTAELPLLIFCPFLTATIGFWLIGFNYSVFSWIAFSICLVLMQLTCYALGMVVSTAILDPGFALRIQPFITIPLLLFAGFFVDLDSIGPWFSWMQYIAFPKYAFRWGIFSTMRETNFTCTFSEYRPVLPLPANQSQNETLPIHSIGNVTEGIWLCPVSTGDAFVSFLGMKTSFPALDLIILVCFFLGLNAIAFTGLAYRSHQY
eukprot:TRINITY_DN832_c0_g1_i14.p1 TRINITY_DN832_c0_g1~~TRINITY_DN832_c0_g1_i14.p1  ORF type:complete len:620 (+),score=89.58 TRINITY_DN832_c0_g1_i14:422-2281(+)